MTMCFVSLFCCRCWRFTGRCLQEASLSLSRVRTRSTRCVANSRLWVRCASYKFYTLEDFIQLLILLCILKSLSEKVRVILVIYSIVVSCLFQFIYLFLLYKLFVEIYLIILTVPGQFFLSVRISFPLLQFYWLVLCGGGGWREGD